jgi:hypothetical protein
MLILTVKRQDFVRKKKLRHSVRPGSETSVLWNRHDLFRFRFRLWKSFGSGSGTGSRPSTLRSYVPRMPKDKSEAYKRGKGKRRSRVTDK